MTITLGGIDISGLTKVQEFSNLRIQTQREVTLGGRELIWSESVDFMPIFLKGTDTTGCLKRSIIQQLYDLANVIGAMYSLNYEGTISTVRFITENGNPITASPIGPRPNQQSEDYYNNISIMLMEVSL